jgi:hypothetical protein
LPASISGAIMVALFPWNDVDDHATQWPGFPGHFRLEWCELLKLKHDSPTVIPAKAGIPLSLDSRACVKLDSRLRGNDVGRVCASF